MPKIAGGVNLFINVPAGLGEARARGPLVAQIFNLPYRRIAFGRASATRSACGLEIRDTAD
ncbi:MAG: hypothetical protein EXS33_01230 [Pedosphaera sp.]|nr:hypothetical protein [Pedosphaera sp.]